MIDDIQKHWHKLKNPLNSIYLSFYLLIKCLKNKENSWVLLGARVFLSPSLSPLIVAELKKKRKKKK